MIHTKTKNSEQRYLQKQYTYIQPLNDTEMKLNEMVRDTTYEGTRKREGSLCQKAMVDAAKTCPIKISFDHEHSDQQRSHYVLFQSIHYKQIIFH